MSKETVKELVDTLTTKDGVTAGKITVVNEDNNPTVMVLSI